jgi:Domain of unknown function (DUF3472).
MKYFWKIFTPLLLLFVSVGCSSSSGDGPQKVSVSISPSKKVIEESAGGELSFSITPTPSSVALKCISNADWMTAVSGKDYSWNVSANMANLSRSGRIYILNKQSLAPIDTIQVVQKSILGTIDEESAYHFTETDVPLEVPFTGNSYITTPLYGAQIDNNTGDFSGNWDDASIVASTYFYVGASGVMNLAMVASNSDGYGKIKVTVNGGKSYVVTVNGPASKIYSIDKIQIDSPGYVKIDVQGVEKSSKYFAKVLEYRIGGAAITGNNNHFVTLASKASDSGFYFQRRGASSHWAYTLPAEDVEYFYNEVTVDKAVNNSYYEMNGFSEGYMGIQQVGDGTHKVLFSVWANPKDIAATLPIPIRTGKDVVIGDFNNEDSGRNCFLDFDWKEGQTYKALVRIKPDGQGNTIYTAYFYTGTEWRLLAAFKRPKLSTYYKYPYSFLENFDPVTSIIPRHVLFKNQWVYTVGGEWKEITNATFTCDGTGEQGLRWDYSGSVDDANHGFILKNFGFSNDHTTENTKFSRKAGGTKPDIDFDALDKL